MRLRGHLRGQLAKAVGVQHAGDCGREQVQRQPPQQAARARPCTWAYGAGVGVGCIWVQRRQKAQQAARAMPGCSHRMRAEASLNQQAHEMSLRTGTECGGLHTSGTSDIASSTVHTHSSTCR